MILILLLWKVSFGMFGLVWFDWFGRFGGLDLISLAGSLAGLIW